MENKKLAEAIEILTNALRTDEGYRMGWIANIAMAFKDECSRFAENNEFIFDVNKEVHEIANTAAENFINQLCK